MGSQRVSTFWEHLPRFPSRISHFWVKANHRPRTSASSCGCSTCSQEGVAGWSSWFPQSQNHYLYEIHFWVPAQNSISDSSVVYLQVLIFGSFVVMSLSRMVSLDWSPMRNKIDFRLSAPQRLALLQKKTHQLVLACSLRAVQLALAAELWSWCHPCWQGCRCLDLDLDPRCQEPLMKIYFGYRSGPSNLDADFPYS